MSLLHMLDTCYILFNVLKPFCSLLLPIFVRYNSTVSLASLHIFCSCCHTCMFHIYTCLLYITHLCYISLHILCTCCYVFLILLCCIDMYRLLVITCLCYILLDVCLISTRGSSNSHCCVLQYVRGKCTTAIPRVASAAEYIEPTQGFDAHVSVIPPRAADSLQNQFDRSQVQCLLHFLARSFPGTVIALS